MQRNLKNVLSKEKIGKVYIDPSMKKIALPLQEAVYRPIFQAPGHVQDALPGAFGHAVFLFASVAQAIIHDK